MSNRTDIVKLDNDAIVAVSEYGDPGGAPVFFCHGWPSSRTMAELAHDAACDLGLYVFDRTNMLLGFAAGFFKTTIPSLGAPGVRDTRILPADLDGPPPPGGRPPNFFVRTVDDQQDPANPTDRIEIYEVLPDWVTLTFSFTLVDTLTPAPFQTMLCDRNGGDFRDCIPQPTVATRSQPPAGSTSCARVVTRIRASSARCSWGSVTPNSTTSAPK